MLILVHGNGFNLDRELRDDVATKMETCFDRFSSRIGRVHVYLADLNGPKKGIDKSIRLVIDVEREPVIVIEEKGEDWLPLLESIADRASQSLARQMKRSRSHKDRVSMAGDNDTEVEEMTASEDIEWNPLSHRSDLRR